MIRRWHRHRFHEPVEMDITAFMNLMVILVPFLLITAVFSHLVILELDIPTPAPDPALATQRFLELTVRSKQLEVADHGQQAIIIKDKDGQHDYRKLVTILTRIKSRRAQDKAITLMLEADTPYDTLIQIMDHVRAAPTVRAAALLEIELFPDISIADATIQGIPQAHAAQP